MAVQTDQGPAPILGRICMDMTMVDLTELPDVHVGDTVELFGVRQRADVLADILGTIPYELTCAVSKRVPRLYMENGAVVERSLRLLDVYKRQPMPTSIRRIKILPSWSRNTRTISLNFMPGSWPTGSGTKTRAL